MTSWPPCGSFIAHGPLISVMLHFGEPWFGIIKAFILIFNLRRFLYIVLTFRTTEIKGIKKKS